MPGRTNLWASAEEFVATAGRVREWKTPAGLVFDATSAAGRNGCSVSVRNVGRRARALDCRRRECIHRLPARSWFVDRRAALHLGSDEKVPARAKGGQALATDSRDVPCQYVCTSILATTVVGYNSTGRLTARKIRTTLPVEHSLIAIAGSIPSVAHPEEIATERRRPDLRGVGDPPFEAADSQRR